PKPSSGLSASRRRKIIEGLVTPSLTSPKHCPDALHRITPESLLIAGCELSGHNQQGKHNENNTDVDRWADARRLRINGKPCSKPWRCLNLPAPFAVSR